MKANQLGIQSTAMRAAQMFFSAFLPRNNREQNYKDRLVHRQARKLKTRLSGWMEVHSSPREEARRRQQVLHDSGQSTRRALPRVY